MAELCDLGQVTYFRHLLQFLHLHHGDNSGLTSRGCEVVNSYKAFRTVPGLYNKCFLKLGRISTLFFLGTSDLLFALSWDAVGPQYLRIWNPQIWRTNCSWDAESDSFYQGRIHWLWIIWEECGRRKGVYYTFCVCTNMILKILLAIYFYAVFSKKNNKLPL